MFDKIGRLAEEAATHVSVSRRGFLGRLGQVALGAAGVLGGLLVLPGTAQAGGGVVCCNYSNHITGKLYHPDRKFTVCFVAGTTCPDPYGSGTLTSSHSADTCSHC
jgi:hypothetical protein